MPKTGATTPPIALPHAPSAGAAMQAPSLGGTALVVSEEHAARMLSLAPRTLQSLRLEGGGPPHVALTSRRVGYLVSELEAWARQRSRTSTSAAIRAERGAQ